MKTFNFGDGFRAIFLTLNCHKVISVSKMFMNTMLQGRNHCNIHRNVSVKILITLNRHKCNKINNVQLLEWK